jgi:hypothetical protein
VECWNVVQAAAEDGGHVEKNEWMERIAVGQRRLMREAVDLALVGLMNVFFGWIITFQLFVRSIWL